jgi:peptidyl-tRNA hydrolase
VITRSDLHNGFRAAQIIHAAGESSPGNLSTGVFAIALEARDEAHLRELSKQLAEKGVSHKLVIESQEPYDGQATAIGVTPGPKLELQRHFSSLPLLK